MLQPKDTDWLNGHKNKTHIYAVCKKLTSDLKTHNRLEVRGWKNISHANGKQKKARVAILISDKIDLKEDYKRLRGHYIMIMGLILRGRHSNCKYLCTQHRSTSIGKTNPNRHKR